MNINQIFELSKVLAADDFQRIFTNKADYMEELDNEYIDTSLAAMGITVMYRDSRYKKKVRLLINAGLVVENVTDTDKLIRKLNKRIAEYFDH